jgi:beta-glucosidase/6-phospho-beta-glucosidase/beta-galactosidase
MPKNNMVPFDQPPTFSSFMMAGFECTYALIDSQRKFRLDLLAASKHDEYCREDYHLIREIGATTVREGLAWHQIDQGSNQYDFSRFEKMMEIGKEEKVQQIWDLNHFDYPDYLDPFSDAFVKQYGEYARRAWEVIRKYQEGTIFLVPLNEISFYSWFGADSGWWAPFKKGFKNGFAFKKQLVRAAIAAMDAIWSEDTDVRFIHVDPIMRRIPRLPTTAEIKKSTAQFNTEIRYQAWDMLAGKIYPEVGGDPKYLDMLGINYYMVNQEWITISPLTNKVYNVMIPLDSPDRVTFDVILDEIYQRYKRPMIISETGSHGEFRVGWWERILTEVDMALEKGLPIYGVCSYPTVDKPTELPFLWPQSGLWDFYQLDKKYHREPCEAALDVIRQLLPKLHARSLSL